eukprot:XP_019920916.1 PREDICTED: uncharacterized protein LOC109617082 [Crassostrea gigas]
MSSVPANPAWSAAKAIDGDTNQNYTANFCAISDISHQNNSAWWKVWLQRPFNVAYLGIYFGSDTYRNATGFSVYTYDTQVFNPLSDPKHLVYYHAALSGCPASVMNITVNRVTHGVVFINLRPSGFTSTCINASSLYTSIDICKVKVMVCSDGTYISSGMCVRCPGRCKNDSPCN